MSKPNLAKHLQLGRQPVRPRARRNSLQRTALHRLNIGIIGGGIGGVAAAVALGRVGIQATVYERARELREVGAGMMLSPNATRVLKDLGLLEQVAASAARTGIFSFAPAPAPSSWTSRWAILKCPRCVPVAPTCSTR